MESKKIYDEFRQGITYFEKMGLTNEWEECEKFYEGDQWAKPTARTRNMPRPVINICQMIADNKKASILSGKIKMIFTPDETFGELYDKASQGAEIFTKFAERISKELNQEGLDYEGQGYATQLGSYIYHYYWDTSVSGGMTTNYVGGLRAEILHPKNVIVQNPMECDIQKQKYIIITSCEPTSSVKELAKLNGIKTWELIGKDTEMDNSENMPIDMTTVLTKYFRVNGKVYWCKSTEESMVVEPTPLTPNAKAVKFDEEDIDEEEQDSEEVDYKKELYPIVFKYHRKRKDSIYGIGEVKQAIPNNKAVNFSLGMMLLSVQQTAWPKIIQKMNALASQQITNEPGEIITDTTRGGNWGVKYLETPGFNNQALTLTDKIIDLTRVTTGSTEVVTGEVMGANMSASAIVALQNQAKKPIEMFQKNFFRAYEEIGRIYEQFFKTYYNDGRLFSYNDEENNTYIAEMNGSKYADFDYSLNVEIISAGDTSDSLTIQILDNLKQAQDIDVDDYIELYPDNIMTFKEKLKGLREKKKQEQQMLLQEQQMMQEMQEKGYPIQ